MPAYSELRFLVVDDMATMRKVVSQQLKAQGVTLITEASDGKVAQGILEKMTAENTPIQFIVSDWNMPTMTGIDLLRFCRASPIYKAIPFLLVTAESDVAQVSEAIAAGVDNYVVKPFTPVSFGEKLAAVFKKRFPAP